MVNGDEVQSEVGAKSSGVAVGKNIRQRIRSRSPNIAIQVTQRNISEIQSKILELSTDIKLLYNMIQELSDQDQDRKMQIAILQGWVLAMILLLLVVAVTSGITILFLWAGR